MIEIITTPSRDWLPVFLPGVYVIGYSIQEYPTPVDGILGEPIAYPGKTAIAWGSGGLQPAMLAYTHFRFSETAPYYAGQLFPVIAFVENPGTGTRAVYIDAPTPADDLDEFPLKYAGGTLYIGDPEADAPPLIVKIEASINGTDFAGAVTAGLAQLPANAADQYSFNPHAYLESTFEPGPPVFGTDHKLFRYYRLVIGTADHYDGTNGTPDIVTTPMRVLYASELTTLTPPETTLSIPPEGANTSVLPGIITVIAGNVVSSAEAPADPIKPCPAYPVHLYWLNRRGGWQSHVFDGKHEYQEEIPEALLFEDYLGFQHKAAIKGARNAMNVFSGYLAADRYDMVKTIRSAIRVYQAIDGLFREVNVKGGTFPIRKEGTRLYECNLSFTYAEPVLIQTA